MLELVRILLKWFKPIIIVSVIAAIGSAIISLLLPEIYTSTYTFQTINSHYMDRSSLFSTEAGQTPVYLFGGKQDKERFIALSQSSELENYIIDKFNLFEHYEIEEDDPQKDYWIKQSIRDNFTLMKTKFGMLEAKVMDEDPKFAAALAETIVQRLDELNKKIINEKKEDVLKIYVEKEGSLKGEVASLKDSINRVLMRNPDDTVTYNMLETLMQNKVEEYSSINTIYNQHLLALNQEYSSIYNIEKPVVAVKRTKPVRWLMVVTGTFIAAISMIFLAIFIEKFKEYNQELAT